MDAKPKVAIGVRPKTGWAIVVVVTDQAHPRALVRERVELLGDPDRFVYHRAEALGSLPAAAKLIDAERGKVIAQARHALERIQSHAAAQDEVVALGVVAAAAKPDPPLEAVLKTHMKVHGAEGRFYPACWIAAGQALNLRVTRLAEKDATLTVAERCDTDEAEAAEMLKAMGARLGRPWDADCKLAAAAAWAALGS
ncbi:MAG TPA: hypothetical protein VGL66_02615 [Caulobacteraceae bacterium]|jgi:hypothetical protein